MSAATASSLAWVREARMSRAGFCDATLTAVAPPIPLGPTPVIRTGRDGVSACVLRPNSGWDVMLGVLVSRNLEIYGLADQKQELSRTWLSSYL
ncbi:hypothetical protein VTK73DRAFT_1003 [Phialemonium thermophilum]|uniref:Uncharacterized protein n=1 Tax=Phialemonium thermophilum TaxID=223376 RepID=A0ABR3VU34_9PEZI